MSDFQQIQVKFYQLFAKIIRWSLEIWKKKLPKSSFVWPKGKRKKIKINWNSQLSCVQDNKQTNKQISKMTPRFKRARRKKLKFQISCKSVHKQRNGRGFSENAESAWAKSWASCAVIGRNKKFTTRKETRFSRGIWSSFKCCVFVIGCAWNRLIYKETRRAWKLIYPFHIDLSSSPVGRCSSHFSFSP